MVVAGVHSETALEVGKMGVVVTAVFVKSGHCLV